MAVKFETEEELQEYINNLGTEYSFSCLKEKNSEGCHLLGDYLQAVKRDFEGAANIYKSNCDDRKYVKSCYKFGTASYLGQGCQADKKIAFDYFKTSCELGSKEACLNTGVMLTNPDKDPNTNEPFIKADFVTGVKYMERACSAGHAIACYFASGIYIAGAQGIPQDRTKASQLAQLACEGGNFFACVNLSRMYKKGDGVEKDEKKAAIYKEKARELRDDERKKASIGLQQYS